MVASSNRNLSTTTVIPRIISCNLLIAILCALTTFSLAANSNDNNRGADDPKSANQYIRVQASPERIATVTLKEITTPVPPTTPDSTTFECEDEGFFKNPKDCRKYFWCLDSGPANLGVVAHAFTCPSGLFFNTKSELCDYPGNVNCKNKPKDSIVTTRRSNRQTTTTTTTSAPTTASSTTSAPPLRTSTTKAFNSNQLTPELLAEALKLAQNQGSYQAQPNNNSNLYQLLQLVQNLGGVDKVRALLATYDRQPTVLDQLSNVNSRNRVYPELTTQPSTPAIFNLSYVTPNRIRDESTSTGQRAPGLLSQSSNLPRNQVRPRRPQYDNSETTPNPLHDGRDRSRTNGLSSARTQSPFSFIYSNPTDRSNPANTGALHRHQFDVRRDNRSVDGFFVYNTPGRFENKPSTRSSSLYATESPEDISRENESRDDSRIPLRVSSGNSVRFPANNGDWEAPNRRPTRVRINSAFEVDDQVNPHIDVIQPYFVSHDPITTRKPIRRRPPQRAHLLKDDNTRPIITIPESSVSYDDESPNRFVNSPLQSITVKPRIQTLANSGEDLTHEYPYLEYANLGLATPSSIPFAPPTTTSTPRPTQRRTRPRQPQPQPIREQPATTSRARPAPAPEILIDEGGPAVIIDANGNGKCARRGVHPHPGTCGQFVVCAPASRTNKELRAFIHHCPAEQVFVQGVGRCRPGNKERCEVFT